MFSLVAKGYHGISSSVMCNGQSTIQSKWGTAAVFDWKTASKASSKKVRWYPQQHEVLSNSKQEAAKGGKDCA